jgi:hypothetical protein
MKPKSKRFAHYSDEEIEFMRANQESMTHAEIARLLGRTVGGVRNKLHSLGYVSPNAFSAEECRVIRNWYQDPARQARDTLDLDELSRLIGRPKTSICYWAGTQGLTDICRSIDKPENRKRMSDRAKSMIATNGHPRGALGLKHSVSTRKTLSEKSKAGWDRRTPEETQDMQLRSIRTKVSRYGNGGAYKYDGSDTNRFSRSRSGKRPDLDDRYFRSSWEANYARYLNWLQSHGGIASWRYEPKTFVFEGVTRGPFTYTPDFEITEKNGSVVFHEVKGWMDSKSRGKLKRFAKFYPDIKIVIIDKRQYDAIKYQVSAAIRGWE